MYFGTMDLRWSRSTTSIGQTAEKKGNKIVSKILISYFGTTSSTYYDCSLLESRHDNLCGDTVDSIVSAATKSPNIKGIPTKPWEVQKPTIMVEQKSLSSNNGPDAF